MSNKKKLISVLLILILLFQMLTPVVMASNENSANDEELIDENNNIVFKDENLKNALIESRFDTNEDGNISTEEMKSITELNISNKDITDIQPLKYAINLTSLSAYNNNISDTTVFSQLQKIESINISQNSIDSIEVFVNLPQLQYLDVSENNIDLNLDENIELVSKLYEKINSFYFTDNSSNIEIKDKLFKEKILQSVYCDYNYDGEISKYEATRVTYIGITDSELTSISGIENFKNLNGLNLDNTSVKDISLLKNLKKLTWVSLNNTEIDDISVFNELNDLTSIYIAGTNVDLSLDENLKIYNDLTSRGVYINVDDTSEIIQFKNQDFKQQLVNNSYLYLDRNQDKEISKLEMLSLTNITISSVSYLQDLQYATNLKNLYIYDYNQEQEVLNFEDLVNFNKLEELSISSIKEWISLDELSKLVNLKNLSFSVAYNGSTTIIDCSYLENLTNLEEIYFYASKLENIETLQSLKQLKKLNISLMSYINGSDTNDDDFVDCKNFKGLENLEDLSISSSDIQNISELSNLKNLKALNIVGSYYQRIDCEELINITSLEKLQLQYGAYLDNIDDIAKLTNLKDLMITNLDYVDMSWLGKLTNLEKLNITGDLGDVSKYLQNLKKLKELDISPNNWESKQNIYFKGMDSLEILTVTCGGYNSSKIDFSEIDSLKNLKELYLSSYNPSNAENVSTIKNLPNLEKITLYTYYSNYSDTSNYECVNVSDFANKNLKELTISGNIEDISSLSELKNLEKLDINNYALSYIGTEKYLNDAEKIQVKNKFTIRGSMSYDAKSILCGQTKTINLQKENFVVNKMADETSNFYNTDEISIQIGSNNSTYPNIQFEKSEVTTNGLNVNIKANDFGTQGCSARVQRSTDYYNQSKIAFDITIYINWLNAIQEDGENEINIPDENFKKVLLEKYDIDEDKKITKNDMMNIEYMDISYSNISNIQGIEYATNLKQLNAAHNSISDLNPIKDLTNIGYVRLEHNKIKDISPLKNFTNIEIRCLSNNLIEDITPLKEFNPDVAREIDFMGNYIDVSEGTKNRQVLKELGFDQYTMICFEISQKYKSPDERNDVLEIKDVLKQRLISYGVDSNNDGNITKGEMNDFNCGETSREGGMFDYCELDLSNLGLTDSDIQCLQYLNCITGLNLSNNNITDVSPLKYIRSLDILNLSRNDVKVKTLEGLNNIDKLDLSYNNIENIEGLEKLKYETGGYGWFAGGDANLRMIEINLSNNSIKNIDVIKDIKRIAKLDMSHNKISDISPLKDYNFTCYEYDGQSYEMLEMFEEINLMYNYIDINKQGNKEAIETFTSKGIPFKYDNQTVIQEGTYIGNLNSELKKFNVGIGTGNATYVSGEIVVVEWIDGVSTVPKVTPKMRFKSTDGTVDMDVFVTATGTNTYYFDRFIEGIDTSKEYYFEVESGDSKNVSEYRKVNVYFSGTSFNNKVVGKYHDKKIKLSGQKITFEEDTYVGNLNTELKQFNVGIGAGNASYVSGEIVVVEWVDGKSTVPEVAPKMRFKSTDETVDMDVFVTATGTNTYYFDRFIEGIDTSKQYYFEIESGDSRNVSEYRKVNVYFSGTSFDNKVAGRYHDQRIRLSGQKMIFEDDTYVGNLNTELKQFNVGIGTNNATYVSGEIVVVEWVDGESTVPTVAPVMRFKSTDGTVDMEVFVTSTGTNTYYFDRYIEGIDTGKKYYFEVESGDSKNVSEYRKVNVYFTGNFADKIVGAYGITHMVVLENNAIVFKPLDKSFPVIMNANEQEIFDLVNQQRVAYGIAPLQIDSRLQLLARRKAEDMVVNGYVNHTSPTYGNFYDMLKTAGISYYTSSENIAAVQGNTLAVTLWMNSTEGHRENILNSSFNYTGVGVIDGGPYGRIYIQMFMGA